MPAPPSSHEAMGLTEPGQGSRAVPEGWVNTDGKLPINVSGELEAKGAPPGGRRRHRELVSVLEAA
ncbi:hypothetical protein [Arthrobacter sp. MMS18-M83]|uniref:hypothetical protein n=1 Tax=Arthrobacter sp. MMS18-M83 TaxID=2996261 RepID=UPI00227B8B0F|nr:hypothetical protein OW521_00795 [Arthrobacter sp. MMS18-M83]